MRDTCVCCELLCRRNNPAAFFCSDKTVVFPDALARLPATVLSVHILFIIPVRKIYV